MLMVVEDNNSDMVIITVKTEQSICNYRPRYRQEGGFCESTGKVPKGAQIFRSSSLCHHNLASSLLKHTKRWRNVVHHTRNAYTALKCRLNVAFMD